MLPPAPRGLGEGAGSVTCSPEGQLPTRTRQAPRLLPDGEAACLQAPDFPFTAAAERPRCNPGSECVTARPSLVRQCGKAFTGCKDMGVGGAGRVSSRVGAGAGAGAFTPAPPFLGDICEPEGLALPFLQPFLAPSPPATAASAPMSPPCPPPARPCPTLGYSSRISAHGPIKPTRPLPWALLAPVGAS